MHECLDVKSGTGQQAGGVSHVRQDVLPTPCDAAEPGFSRWLSLVRARRTRLHRSAIGPALLRRFPGMSGVPIGAGLELAGDGDAHVFIVGS